jgi:hypothetical protein
MWAHARRGDIELEKCHPVSVFGLTKAVSWFFDGGYVSWDF